MLSERDQGKYSRDGYVYMLRKSAYFQLLSEGRNLLHPETRPRIRIILNEMEFVDKNDELMQYLMQTRRQAKIEFMVIL